MRQARCALLSVHDKKGIESFARGLSESGIRIISTKGTARHLREAGIDAVEIAEYAGFEEILGGRVKSLHPKIHAGILASRESEAHRLEMKRLGWDYIDIVAVNLPLPLDDAESGLPGFMDRLDIGGHALLRAAAKNFQDVVVICNPSRYGLILDELKLNNGVVSDGLRLRLAQEAIEASAGYDSACSRALSKFISPAAGALPVELELNCSRVENLRYGENPHQRAALYRDFAGAEPSVVGGSLLGGKALSFNNCLDLDAAIEIVKEFQQPACAIIKHANPCGVALGADSREAYGRARAADPESAFGGIVGFNVPVDKDAALEISSVFVECVVAPSFTGEALELLSAKKSLRILELHGFAEWVKKGSPRESGYELRSIKGGILLQERDLGSIGLGDIRHVTKARPSASEAGAIFFAWTVVRHVRSNAIVIASSGETVGIGAGQMSRVDAARIAVSKARRPLDGCVAASDGFFPFRDAVDELFRSGVRTIVQPGGSKMDGEIIAACDELGIAMVFTGMRCFKH